MALSKGKESKEVRGQTAFQNCFQLLVQTLDRKSDTNIILHWQEWGLEKRGNVGKIISRKGEIVTT